MITLIAAVAKNGVIGTDNKTPWNIPEEMELFKNITSGHAIIVGRKTFESIGHALPGRRMYVLTRNPLPSPCLPARQAPPIQGEGGDIVFCSSIKDALEKTKKERTIFVIGGSEVYAEFMPLADEMRISHLYQEYSGDIFFPKIDNTIWQEISRTEYKLFTHIHYTRNAKPSKN
ncbi:MAG: dihydrofolate reductase [Candidatus Andersenbacteria bacterium]